VLELDELLKREALLDARVSPTDDRQESFIAQLSLYDPRALGGLDSDDQVRAASLEVVLGERALRSDQ
jgi:hypothetical protein